MTNPRLILALLITVCFTGATVKENHPALGFVDPEQNTSGSDVLTVLMGDSRRLFANQFLAKADAYFHNGYYPTIFDRPVPKERSHMQALSEGHDEKDNDHDENEEAGFLGKPADWIESFGRNFFASQHSHLKTGNEREVLPWLRLSADLDPQNIQIYKEGSFLLRSKLGKVNEAEQFLREGLRENPDSYEILFELGRIRDENHNDDDRARTLYELALQKWQKQKDAGKGPDEFVYEQITVFLARLEERTGNLDRAIGYLEKAKEVSPAKDVLEKQIAELKEKQRSSPGIPKK